jgi:hypothetical protein
MQMFTDFISRCTTLALCKAATASTNVRNFESCQGLPRESARAILQRPGVVILGDGPTLLRISIDHS